MKKQIALAASLALTVAGAGLALAQDNAASSTPVSTVNAAATPAATPAGKHKGGHHHKKTADVTPTPTN